jgi:hypothetical protein
MTHGPKPNAFSCILPHVCMRVQPMAGVVGASLRCGRLLVEYQDFNRSQVPAFECHVGIY